MPYIKQRDREVIEVIQQEGVTPFVDTAGSLNYLITQLLVRYVEHNGLCYQTINDIIGALAGAQAEFYRRVAVPYETQKIADNGDVYPVELTQGGQR